MLVVVLGFFVAVAAYWVVWLCVFCFFFYHTVQHVGSYFTNQVLNQGPPAVEVQTPNHWTAREFPEMLVF